MNSLPIIPHLEAHPPAASVRTVELLVKALRGERPELVLPVQFGDLAVRRLEDGPTLHLDDLSEITWLDRGRDVRFYQDRARLRAGNSDLIATCADPVPGAEEYCHLYLGLGPQYVPRTESASNLAYLAKRVDDLSNQFDVIGLKLPCCGGGDGNLVLNAAQFRGQPLHAIREMLKERLDTIAWNGCSPLLIDGWETEVVCAPSAQLWVPPDADSPPLVEGIFVQTVEGLQGSYVGNVRADFPARVTQEIADQSWLLARLFQKLGYVGRCSFDMILVGRSLADCRVEFIECNGRWGGTSLPMTLMNRLFGDWARQPYAVQVAHNIPGLDQIDFARLLEFFTDDLYDARTGDGSLIFVNPGRLKYQAGITCLTLGASWDEAARRAQRMPDRLTRFTRHTLGDGIMNQHVSAIG